MHIQKYFGVQLRFDNGFSFGFSWVHGNGGTSKRTAILASFHPPRSITWLWVLCWNKPTKIFSVPKVTRWKPSNELGSTTITLPIGGEFTWRWQAEMLRSKPLQLNPFDRNRQRVS